MESYREGCKYCSGDTVNIAEDTNIEIVDSVLSLEGITACDYISVDYY